MSLQEELLNYRISRGGSTVWVKKDTLVSITSRNINRFSKSFHPAGLRTKFATDRMIILAYRLHVSHHTRGTLLHCRAGLRLWGALGQNYFVGPHWTYSISTISQSIWKRRQSKHHWFYQRCSTLYRATACSTSSMGVRVNHFSYPTRTRSRWCIGVARILSGGALFYQKSWQPFFSRHPQRPYKYTPNLSHPAKTVLKIDCSSGWRVHFVSWGYTYIFFPVN